MLRRRARAGRLVGVLVALAVVAGCGPAAVPRGYAATVSIRDPDPDMASIAPHYVAADCGAPLRYSVFMSNAYGADWSKPDGLIALNRKGSDGRYHIFTVRPDGTDLRQMGVGSATFPRLTTGSPAWSPDGKFMAFVAEKPHHPGGSFPATPGWGSYSDLWVSTSDGSRAWPLTDLPVEQSAGTILPQFSPDGHLLEWTQFGPEPGRTGFFFVIKVARFSVSPLGIPSLSDVQTIDPGGLFSHEFLETGGFSADSTKMLFTSDFQDHEAKYDQIYSLDLLSGAITKLSSGDYYDEHPRYTPSGQVIYMTDEHQPLLHGAGDDWWIMNSDGSDPHRLTGFNQPSSPEYFGRTVFATVVNTDNWSPDGTSFYGDVELRLLSSQSDIVKVTLTCH